MAGAKLGNALAIDVEADDLELARQRHGQRQADVAETDDNDFTDAGHYTPESPRPNK